MRARFGTWVPAVGALLLLLLAMAAPVSAEEGECREECAEARAVCHAAAHRAHRVCREACAEGDESCRETCRRAFHLARARCAEERLDCREACRPDGACDCVAGCAERLQACREILGECRDDCRDEARDHLMRCRELAENGAPPLLVRACVRAAERNGQECAIACQGVLRCGERFADCVEDCPR